MDFRSLLGQFQKDASRLATSSSLSPSSSATTSRTSTNERLREDESESKSSFWNNCNNSNNKKRKRDDMTTMTTTTTALPTMPVRHIFCLCPAGVETGGPEALHQLCDMIHRCSHPRRRHNNEQQQQHVNNNNSKTTTEATTTTTTKITKVATTRTVMLASMLYLESTKSRGLVWARHAKTPTIYQSYQVPIATWDPRVSTTARDDGNTSYASSSSSSSCLLIWPEVWTDAMLEYLDDRRHENTTKQRHDRHYSALASAKRATKAGGGDDDAATTAAAGDDDDGGGACQCAIWWLSVDNNNGKFQEWHRRDILHLVQSHYARQYLQNKGVPSTHIVTMTEYISNIPVMTMIATTTRTTTKPQPDNNNASLGASTKNEETKHEPSNSQFNDPYNKNGKASIPSTPSNVVVVGGGGGGGVNEEKAKRDLGILYNPLKGLHYTDAIRKRSQGALQQLQQFQSCASSGHSGDGGHIGIGAGTGGCFCFEPIFGATRISPTQVRQRLQRAKIYLDFGPHPGMDRLPREAALCGCVVITNQQGAAAFDDDVPLPAQFKIKHFDTEVIHKLLKHVLEHWDECTHEMEDYRWWIRGQEDRMRECVEQFLQIVVDQRENNNNGASMMISKK